jgi:hypothetical protein
MQRKVSPLDLTQMHIESFSCRSRQDMIKKLWCVSDPSVLDIAAKT